MNKIMVDIEVPIAQRVFEVLLPAHLCGFEILSLVIKLVVELTDGIFMESDETILCGKEDGSILDLNVPIWMSGIKNGDRLVLI